MEILEADSIKQAEMKERKRKEFLRRTRKLPETKASSRNLINMYKLLGLYPCKIFGTVLKMNQGGIQTNVPEDQKVDDDEQGNYIRKIAIETDHMRQEKKEADTPKLKKD